MESKAQMTEYKKSFWSKLKEKIIKLFSKNKESVEEEKILTKEINNNEIIEKIEDNSKKEFMKVYEQIKNQKIELDELDENTLYKIMHLLKEEIDIVNKKIDLEIDEIAIRLNSLNIYNNKLQS